MRNTPLTLVVMRAYDLKSTLRIARLPWMDTERYDIEAVVPDGVDADRFRTMLKELLADRFSLKARWESRQLAGYDLSVAEGGPKLKVSTEAGAARPRERAPVIVGKDGMPVLPPGDTPVDTMTAAGHVIRARSQTMEDITAMLSRQLFAPVRDLTGLSGVFDYTLSWNFDRPASRSPATDSGVTLFVAVRKQLGLKLAPAKQPIPLQVLVVEAASKAPKEN